VGQNIVPNVHAFFYNRAERIKTVNEIVRIVHNKFNLDHTDDETLTSQLFGTTIVEDGTSIKKHHDSENNLFWQLKGRSRWMIFDSYENAKPKMDMIVEEGDMIFIPSNTIHYVESESPRAGVAILFDRKK
jgi:oxalate decarboxylase/phosphoglucose isomerase-like protein (cupin superfamily)